MAKTFIFKFGGASTKDADSVKNLSKILHNRLRNHTVIVVSAMGKTTNALEVILNKKLIHEDYSSNITILKNYHLNICNGLFAQSHPIFSGIENLFLKLTRTLDRQINKDNYDEAYDGIISFGELIASRIIQEYLCDQGLFCLWQDARELIVTNEDFRFAKLDWEKTKQKIQKYLLPKLMQFPVLTQGFIGQSNTGKTTTLGREGSDFSAAIFATCLKSNSVTIWKDVAGVLNADPKRFNNTVKFDELDYREAAELTYYGASVIHPKTIKPLANHSIPLFVKSFLDPEASGTKIHHVPVINKIPCLVVKDEQILVSFKVTDFTFINESHIHKVFAELEKLKLRVNLLQNSAISISIVIDKEVFKLEKLIEKLQDDFEIRYNEGLQLLTIKNPHSALVEDCIKNRNVLLEQVTRATFQTVMTPLS
ncbi:MAG: aspartate kinase [Mongoliibacter sp.]|uniref:aspartate kinase n=1 Tax=Mongoliibacter sp. TaxID=2022438 RepID=UPI0012F2F907|nr:aspartate kinase [Mongoliibacter sp.]TVP49013.1 MAG: aspartate kinase [Mongoliibacter sp.]